MEPVLRLLIVEDNIMFRDYLKEIISETFPHITVDETGVGDEALAKISASKPVIILMDIGLPGKNGLQLTREIKATHPDIRIVILTGLGRSHKKAAYEYGADTFFEKGVSSLEEILEALRSFLASDA